MGKKVFLQRKRLSAIFVSFAILLVGSASLFESMSIDYYSVLNTVQKIIPASIVLGCIGWVMGMILDKPKSKRKSGLGDANLYLNNILNEENSASQVSFDNADTDEGK